MADSSEHQGDVTLAQIGFDITRLFDHVKSAFNGTTDSSTSLQATGLAQAERFDLWAISLGLHQTGHASLDYRFRDAPNIHEYALTLLTDLESALYVVSRELSLQYNHQQDYNAADEAQASENAAQIENDSNSDEGSILDDYEEDSVAEAALQTVVDCMDRLFRLSIKIRNPSARTASSKAFQYEQVDPDTKEDLVQCYYFWDYRHVEELFLHYRRCSPEEFKDNFLVQRLAKANVRRRQQFAYWKRHKLKQIKRFEKTKNELESLTPMALIGDQHKSGTVSGYSRPTTATHLDPTTARNINFSDNQSVVTTMSAVAPMLSLQDDDVTFPAPPEKHRNKTSIKEFECPFCHIVCSKQLLKESAWKAHIVKDLRPYVCTYEHCSNPLQLYDDMGDWINHEANEHGFRASSNSDSTCDSQQICGRQEGRVFPNKSCPFEDTCPICLKPSIPEDAIHTHVACHLLRIATFSLPQAADSSDDTQSADAASNRNVAPYGSDDSRHHDFRDESILSFSERPASIDDPSEREGIPYPLKSKRDQDTNPFYPTRAGTFSAAGVDALESVDISAIGLQDQGKYVQIDETQRHALARNEEALSPEYPDTLTNMANLASTYHDQGRWREAEELEAQVVETRKRVLGAGHPDTLTSMANLASKYLNQGRWTEAEELEAQVMEARKRVLGADHRDTLTSMANLASMYQSQGRLTEAEELFVQVIETKKRVLGADHRDTLTSMANLASTYWNQGRWTEAEELEAQVMETRKRVLGTNHPATLTSMANLASTYQSQGRLTGAEELFVQVTETKKRVLGADHRDTLTSMANLASTYRSQGRWTEAEELEAQVMEARKRVLGADHPATLTSMARLASMYQIQGRWTEAEELEVQVMETRKRLLGADHPATLASMARLASTYHDQGRWTEAEELEAQVVEARKIVLGADHPDTLTSMASLASTYQSQGRWKEAEELEAQVMEARKRVLGADHPDTLTSMANLASMYQNQARRRRQKS